MTGEKDLGKLLRTMKPEHNAGEYVFCPIGEGAVAAVIEGAGARTDVTAALNSDDVVLLFKEREGITVVCKKEWADSRGLPYTYVASWITLTEHSSLEAEGLTAAFSKALAGEGISCNVVAALYHDHIFVDKKDTGEAMRVLRGLSE